LAFAALIAAILAPTDAALGLPIFTNLLVPERIRRALNVESGLNDGIATPFVTLFLAFAISTQEHAAQSWLLTALGAIALGVASGALIGAAGAWLLTQAHNRDWTSDAMKRLAILAVGLTAYFGAVLLQGNGFIAAFVAGITFGYVSHGRFAEPTAFTETLSELLSLLVWTIFGALLLSAALTFTTDWRPILYAALSLTLIRMLPVALSLLGMGFRADTVAIIGWFGPRGLASVAFTWFNAYVLRPFAVADPGSPSKRATPSAPTSVPRVSPIGFPSSSTVTAARPDGPGCMTRFTSPATKGMTISPLPFLSSTYWRSVCQSPFRVTALGSRRSAPT
jgi:NhaP-type Na+/H+ or K+/H+ antiporter